MNCLERKTDREPISLRTIVSAGILCLASMQGLAADEESRAGHGHYSLSFQVIRIDGFKGSGGTLPIGTADTQSLSFDVEYNLTDRITISAGIPYVKKRYNGGARHDPLTLNPPRPYIENVDALDWNTDFQDFHLGVKYLAYDKLLRIEPYAFLGVPSHEYAFFGHAAVGQQLLKFDVGTSITWSPGLSDAYYGLDLGYVFVEETLGVSIDHWLITGEAGYFFSPRLSGRVFAQLKKGHGLTFPDSFPPPRDSEMWYQHDRLVKHNYMNVGIGVDWAIDDKHSLTASAMHMTRAEQVHVMKYAFNVGVSRSF